MYFDYNKPVETMLPALRAMLAAPDAFFRDLPKGHSRVNALFLLTVTTLLLGAVATVFHGFGWLFLLPVVWGLMLGAAWLWSLWLRRVSSMAGGERLTRVLAFEITAYAALPLAVAMTPWVGWLGVLFSLYLQVRALAARGAKAGAVWLMLGAPVLAAGVAGWMAWVKVIAPQLAALAAAG